VVACGAKFGAWRRLAVGREPNRWRTSVGQTVLVVEDEIEVAQDIRRTLIGFGYEVPVVAATGSDALNAVERHAPDIALVDIQLDGSLDGVQTAVSLQEKHHVPVVYLASDADDAILERAKETGPYGYIVKPFTDRELRTSIEVALSRHEWDTRATAKANLVAAANLELVVRESERLRIAARTDPLTEAANRRHLQEDLDGIADRARRYGHQYCAAFCDIDAFKNYNDSFGHLAGDDAIRIVSQTIRAQLRRGDGFYRYGGDELLLLLPEQSLASAKECMERTRWAVASLPTADSGGFLARAVTISVGIADLRVAADEDPIESWLQRADAALYRAKARGRNCIETAA
jgi:two-component system cell cycle response regulator